MDRLHLRILPVYSQYHPTERVGDVRLLLHQAETLEQFKNPAVDVIINIAMTGDGKSLAGYLPTYLEQQHVIAMYPTNELVRDQWLAQPHYQQRLGIRLPRYDTMYSDKITQLMREHDTIVRLEEVRKLLERNGILLTNPDIIHLIMSHQYGWGHMRKELPVTLGAYFDYLLIDEFHVFGIPQVIAVMNMLGYLATYCRDKPTTERKKFVFLSATPSKLLERLLVRSGLRYQTITGHYSSSDKGEEYRCILQPCEIELHEISQETPIERWVEERLEQIADFFQHNPGSKAAILVYSPATAQRLVMRLKAYFEPLGITIGKNTGLTSPEERQESLKKHILVGTSTVDIGIDFHINYLIFEGFNAGSFLQRFGRLGRHDEFTVYRAYALVPRFVLERVTMHFVNQTEVEREVFNEAIREAFPTEQEFASYTRLWGVVQAAHVTEELLTQSKLDANQAFREALLEQYEHIYGTAEKPVMPRARNTYWRLKKECPEILDELLSFRGQSPLECGVWDTKDNHLQTYDLFFLLANTKFELMEEEDFMQEVRERKLEERNFKGRKFYLKIGSYVPERLHLLLGLHKNFVEKIDLLERRAVFSGFYVHEPRHEDLDKVNPRLKKLKLVCILSAMPRNELKQRLKLGALFPVYRVQDDTGNEYSIAFGQEALLLDSILSLRRQKNNGGYIMA